MMKKLLVSLLSALLCMTVAAKSRSNGNTEQNNPNNNSITIDGNGDVFVSPLWYHISSDSTAEVIKDDSYKELESVVIPSQIQIAGRVYSVTSIGDNAFSVCLRLTSISIPSSVTSIEDGAFSHCVGLKDIEIPSSVISIGYEAFYDCSGLTHIEIPSSVTNIEKNAFGSCDVLSSINVVSDNSIYSSEDGVLYDKNKRKLICVPAGKNGKFVIPSSVTSIGNYAFMYCRGLTRIVIPSSVTRIGEGAFSFCRGLTSIEIPSSVTSIEKDAFRDCIGLKKIEVPSSVTSIDMGAFRNCRNLEIIIDNSIKNVSVVSDAFKGCKSVKFLK